MRDHTPKHKTHLQTKAAISATAGRASPGRYVEPSQDDRMQRAVGNQGMQALLKTHRSAPVDKVETSALHEFETSPGQPLDAMTRATNQRLFGQDFGHVRLHTDADAAESAHALRARAYTVGRHIVFGRGQFAPATRDGRQLLAHELAHVIQNRGNADPASTDVEPAHGAAEAEAARAGSLVRVGLPPGAIHRQTGNISLTPTSTAIEPLITYGAADWVVTDAEERSVLTLLRADTTLSTTITDLNTSGFLGPLIERVDEPANRFELLRLLGSGLSPAARLLVEPHVRALGPEYEMQFNLGRLGVSSTATAFSRAPYAGLVGSPGSTPFSGVGATGVNPTSLSIPWADQALLAGGHAATTALYSNPVGSLPGYLATLTSSQRMQQAELLIKQPISSVDSGSYAGNAASRAEIFMAAGRAHNLEPALIAAFILAEQRDQSANEDAKDYTAATSTVYGANTSIGLGQVVISTAQRHSLFQDLLSSTTSKSLGHNAVARLLASDEYNIFAAAAYIRHVANDGSTRLIASLPSTQAAFPSINMAAYAGHSSTWPADNIRALGSEYTSRAWDDVLVAAWGDFVFEAYNDIKASGAL
jgi:Domain of unknown function (DUF4157)